MNMVEVLNGIFMLFVITVIIISIIVKIFSKRKKPSTK